MIREYGIPKSIALKVTQIIKLLGYDFSKSKNVAEGVMELSTHFHNQEREPTPWEKPKIQAAYLAYFLPLGMARISAVINELIDRNFFSQKVKVLDFGSGPGTASLVLESLMADKIQSVECVERSRSAIELHKKLTSLRQINWRTNIESSKNYDVLIMSYVLNELPQIPDWIFDIPKIILFEPSTRKDFVRLAELRKLLLERGYHLWAPCPHEKSCPLVEGRDWCHDRIGFVAPDWWDNLGKHLPIRNDSLTFSYLVASREAPTLQIPAHKDAARVIGDTLKEKGKTRQLICRTTDREFLSWLHKNGEPEPIARGTLIAISQDAEKRGQEVRVSEEVEYLLKSRE